MLGLDFKIPILEGQAEASAEPVADAPVEFQLYQNQWLKPQKMLNQAWPLPLPTEQLIGINLESYWTSCK